MQAKLSNIIFFAFLKLSASHVSFLLFRVLYNMEPIMECNKLYERRWSLLNSMNVNGAYLFNAIHGFKFGVENPILLYPILRLTNETIKEKK